MCSLKIFGTKTKAKSKKQKQHSEIENNEIEICTILWYFALNIFYRLILM